MSETEHKDIRYVFVRVCIGYAHLDFYRIRYINYCNSVRPENTDWKSNLFYFSKVELNFLSYYAVITYWLKECPLLGLVKRYVTQNAEI